MQPTKETSLFFLNDNGVLFDERTQKLFHLNTTATFIWCLLEEGKHSQDIQTDLQSTFSLSQADAAQYLEQTELLFQSLGVLQGFEKKTEDKTAPTTETLVSKRYSDEQFCAERHYRLLSSHIRMRFSHQYQLSCVDPVLNHLQGTTSCEATVTIDIIQENSENIILYRNQVPTLSCREESQLAPMAKSLVWQTAVNAHNFFLDIHAGVVGDGERCYLFPAAPGSGKSTLTATLVHHGFEFFSDEVALLHENTLQVQAVPLAICVKDTGVDALSRYYPDLPKLRMHLRSDGKRVRYMPPIAKVVPPAETLRHVGAIIFPQYTPDQPTKLESIETIEALTRLMKECLIVDTHLDKKKVSDLLNWIRKTPCYRLTISDLDAAVVHMKKLSYELSEREDKTA